MGGFVLPAMGQFRGGVASRVCMAGYYSRVLDVYSGVSQGGGLSHKVDNGQQLYFHCRNCCSPIHYL